MKLFKKGSSSTSKKESKKRKVSVKVLLIVAFVVIIAVWIVVWSSIYFYRGSSESVDAISRFVPYPAIILSPTQHIYLHEINEDVRSISQFYSVQDFAQVGMRVDFSTNEGKQRLKVRERMLINKRIEEQVIKDIVHENGQAVTDAELQGNIQRKLSEYGTSQSVKKNLQTLYGWDMDDFAEKIVRPSLYKEKAEKIYKTQIGSDKNSSSLKSINEAYQAIGSGAGFEKVAKEYSVGSSAQEGGRVGFVALDQIDKVLAQKLPVLQIGEVSEVIESELGYHIILVHSTKKQSSEVFYDVSQVFVRKYTFADYLSDQIIGRNIIPFLSEYTWNKETGMMEFRNTELMKFEETIYTELYEDLHGS